MLRTPVTSSNCVSVGYDATTWTLEVEFRHGGIYPYFDAPASECEALLSASSVGGCLDARIKKVGYRYRKL
ncbi:MAG: KTSC domain-containing protein [Clostridiales bacterium]|nr:KTSC domain-containing protein [Clostridiales bacterium]